MANPEQVQQVVGARGVLPFGVQRAQDGETQKAFRAGETRRALRAGEMQTQAGAKGQQVPVFVRQQKFQGLLENRLAQVVV